MEDFHVLGGQKIPKLKVHRSTPSCQLDGECALCTRLQKADQVVLEAKIALQRALDQRNQLKIENNHIHDPFSQRLPIEIACRIFNYCLPALPTTTEFAESDFTFRTESFQLTLGSVCQGWRRIVWSNPRFWTYVKLSLTPKTHPSFAGLVDEWLARSGRLPLVIFIHYYQPYGESQDAEANPVPFMDPLVKVLASYANRWSLVAAYMPRSFWKKLQRDSAQVNLEGLSLTTNEKPLNRHEGERVFTLGIAPSPKVLSINSYRLQDIHVEFHNLTAFNGTSLQTSDCLELLRLSPQLISCNFTDIPEPGALYNTLVHPSLKTLELTNFPRALTNAITSPSLESIDFTMYHEPFASIRPFIQRCGHTIKSAVLSNAAPEDEGLTELLEYAPSLEHISIVDVNIGDNFFRRLSETACLPEGQIDGYLPRLKSLAFWTCLPFDWCHLHQMIITAPLHASMQRRPLASITVDVYGDPGESGISESEAGSDLELIGQEDLQKILDLIESGVDIKVRDEGGQDIIAASYEYYNTEGLSDSDT